jgi:hypothetical protein
LKDGDKKVAKESIGPLLKRKNEEDSAGSKKVKIEPTNSKAAQLKVILVNITQLNINFNEYFNKGTIRKILAIKRFIK